MFVKNKRGYRGRFATAIEAHRHALYFVPPPSSVPRPCVLKTHGRAMFRRSSEPFGVRMSQNRILGATFDIFTKYSCADTINIILYVVIINYVTYYDILITIDT